MDAKLKLLDNTAAAAVAAKAETKKKKDKVAAVVALDENAAATAAQERTAVEDVAGTDDELLSVAQQPGAVAVRGPEYQGSGFSDAATAALPWTGEADGRGGSGAINDDDDDEAPPLHVDSYLVPERGRLTDEEIRQRILAETEHAEAVDKVDRSDSPPRGSSRNAAVWLLLVVVVAVAIAVGVTVPLSKQQTSGSTAATQYHDDSVVAYLRYLEFQGSGGFAGGISAETRKTSAGSIVTSGALEAINCWPKVCHESDANCVASVPYVPGCCAGADCSNETQCGKECPMPPTSCQLIDPTNATACLRSECYTCNDEYVLKDYAFAIDCLEVGTAVRPDNGQMYKWAIFCGPVIVGPVVEQNNDLGEYQCAAARLGANFSDDTGGGGLMAGVWPCQYLALAECGCGPPDMFTFGLPAPTGPCQTDSGCPFLCEGVGGSNDYAKNLCRSFPGNISWWEGRNVFNESLIRENVLAPKYEYELYVKGVE